MAGDIQSDPIAPAQDQNNSVEDAVEVDEQESDEDEDDEEDDNASDEDQDADEEEEELCEISKLKVNVMVIKNKLKSLEEAIGSKSSSEGEDSSSVSDELSRYKEETREELDSLFKRVDELDEMPEALKSEDAKIEELKSQLDSAEAKREENKKMILALIDEIKETKEKGDANEQTNQDLGLGKIEDKIASIESKITDLQNSQSGGEELDEALKSLSKQMEVLEQAFKDQDVPPPPPPPIEEDESSDSKISDLSDKIRILEEKLSEVQNQLGGFTKSDDIVSLDEVKGLISESATTAGHPDSDEGKTMLLFLIVPTNHKKMIAKR